MSAPAPAATAAAGALPQGGLTDAELAPRSGCGASRATHQYPIEKRLAAEIPLARQDFLDIYARHGERGASARGLAESACVHGADVRTAQGTAAHRTGVREPPRLRSHAPQFDAVPRITSRAAQA